MDNRTLKRRSKQGALISSFGFIIIVAAFAFASWKLEDLNSIIVQKNSELTEVSKSVDIKKVEEKQLRDDNEKLKKSNIDLQDQLLNKNKTVTSLSENVNRLQVSKQNLNQELAVKQESFNTLNKKIITTADSLAYFKRQTIFIQNQLKQKKDSTLLMEERISKLNSQLLELESEKNALNSFLDNYTTKDNLRIEPRATASPVGKYYNFKIWLDIPQTQLRKISKVTYFFNHSSFKNPSVTVDSPKDGFRTGYTGWGCLNNMPITVTFNNGKEETIIFKMCSYINDGSVPSKGGSNIPIKGKGR
ncbi:hypothetical protein QQ008_19770 [Fulvivirgaceae bacterium BMA10]|uniref:Prokaryotic YEATS domain-containing protein n=1 Tax=Splendidivirga corallicola TaxID=3051826 RepID=A0ABT8KS97_9BACT|nr:hypothetical protein [Fulvivirgaceae bacterium BMA10]